MKRKTHFNTGGLNPFQGDDVDPFSAVRDEEGGTDPRAEGPISEAMRDETSGRELSTRRNLETGEYYSTEPIEAPKKAAPKAPAIKTVKGSGRSTGRGGPTASEMAAYHASKKAVAADARKADIAAERKSVEERKTRLSKSGVDAIEQDTDLITPFPGISRLLKGAKAVTSRALANRAPDVSELTFLGRSGARNVTPPRQIEGPGRKALKGPDDKEKVSGGSTPKLPPGQNKSSSVADRARAAKMGRRRDDLDMPNYSKGGSASSRADGCASRGKTRGKIY
jgi:hypothetical protein